LILSPDLSCPQALDMLRQHGGSGVRPRSSGVM
jgi:hypothetical protein